MSSQPVRDDKGQFLPGHGKVEGVGHPVEHGGYLLTSKRDFPLVIDFGKLTADQGAQHFLIAASFAEEIIEKLAERSSPEISRSISAYAEAQARLANLANTLLGGGAKPAEWGDLKEYDEAMASLERALGRIATVLKLNRDWVLANGVFKDDTTVIHSPVARMFGSNLKKFAAVGLIWARAWMWIETRKRPSHLPDEIARIVEGASR